MSKNSKHEVVEPIIEWDDDKQQVTWRTDTEVHTYSYARISWENCYMKATPGPLADVTREYAARLKRGDRLP